MLTSEIAGQGINIANLKIINKSETYFELNIDLEVESVKKLRNLKAHLRSIKVIYSVDRI